MPSCAARGKIGSISSDWVKKCGALVLTIYSSGKLLTLAVGGPSLSHVSVQILESLVSVGAYLILFIPNGSTANFIFSFRFIPFSELPEKNQED